ncbi:MAG TPA: nucleoside hydrolase-like domain-containing protein, partial [Steroidobacteraceae bacterium]|nr:nucleoside hydrolase-like domain-containing protein [Steroidobacteraceae bacterium]
MAMRLFDGLRSTPNSNQPDKPMNKFILCCTASFFLALGCYVSAAANTPHQRMIVLTDIEAEVDDTESMVRLMLYSNVIDIEGLIATTS